MEPYCSNESYDPRVELDAVLIGLNRPAELRALERRLVTVTPSSRDGPSEKLELVLYRSGPDTLVS